MTITATDSPVTARFGAAVRQDKPWGHELLFADGRAGYVGKIIQVAAGESLSLQLHREKEETMLVLSGTALVEYGPDPQHLSRRVLQHGDTLHLPPTTLHRVSAVTELVLVEASTAADGWREDVVRFDDRYGRTGTSAP
jgi:mannose-6-phosphate isomerase-like protein (cupin superfamily)